MTQSTTPPTSGPPTLADAQAFLDHHRLAVESRRRIQLSASIGTITFFALATYWMASSPILEKHPLPTLALAALVIAVWLWQHRLLLRGIEAASAINRAMDYWLAGKIESQLSHGFGQPMNKPGPLDPNDPAKKWAEGPPFRVSCIVAVGGWFVLLLTAWDKL
jgi:hypothetical protein